jgi:hypothetical protein
MTGPSSAIQTSAATTTDTRPDTERSRWAGPPATARGDPGARLRRLPSQHRGGHLAVSYPPDPYPPRSLRTAAGTADMFMAIMRSTLAIYICTTQEDLTLGGIGLPQAVVG